MLSLGCSGYPKVPVEKHKICPKPKQLLFFNIKIFINHCGQPIVATMIDVFEFCDQKKIPYTMVINTLFCLKK